MKQFSLTCAVAIFFFSCTQSSVNSFSKYLNESALRVQTFNVDINHDTTLITKGNCIIQIPEGSIVSDQTDVKLEIQEALNSTDIVLAGLTTTNGNNILNSGGMFKISPANGSHAQIRRALKVLIPTKNYNANMNVYKGVEKNGKIDWQDPEPLPDDSLQIMIKAGKALFNADCQSCHKANADFTGPALEGTTERRSLLWIDRFIHNPTMMISGDPAGRRLFERFQPTVMTAFPELTNKDVYAILAYAETVGGASPSNFVKATADQIACADSCEAYLDALERARDIRQNIDNAVPEDFFTLERSVTVPQRAGSEFDTGSYIPPPIESARVKAVFYTVDIKAFGWHNVDVMADNNKCEPSQLTVNTTGEYDNDPQVMLIIPSVKLFVEGEKQPDNSYTFKEPGGEIPLPQNVNCYIIAFCESGGKLFFGKSEFVSALKQNIILSLSETDNSGLAESVRSLKLDGVQATVNDSKTSIFKKELQDADTRARNLAPTNCNCDLPVSDSLAERRVPIAVNVIQPDASNVLASK